MDLTAQHKTAEVAKDSALTRGHAALGNEFVQSDEAVIHLLSGLKIAVTVEEVSQEINKFGRLQGSVTSTERRVAAAIGEQH